MKKVISTHAAIPLLMIMCLGLTASACRRKSRPSASQPDSTAASVQEQNPGPGGSGPGAAAAGDPHFTTKPVPTNAPPPLRVDPKTGSLSVVSDTKVLKTKVVVEGK